MRQLWKRQPSFLNEGDCFRRASCPDKGTVARIQMSPEIRIEVRQFHPQINEFIIQGEIST